MESGSALGDPGRPGLGLGYLRACRYDLYWARKTAGSFFGKAATPRGGRGRGGGGGEVKSTKKDWASFARGLARSPYHGGPRLESNEASLFEGAMTSSRSGRRALPAAQL